MNISEILDGFRLLSNSEKEAVIEKLNILWGSSEGQLKQVLDEVVSSSHKNMACPHCQSEKTQKRGKSGTIQKFSCKACGKFYRLTSGTALYYIKKKDSWHGYLKLMEEGASIRRAAKELGISMQTSFDWRHKILSSLQGALPTKVGGIVECDELQIAYSEKGVKQTERKPRKRGNDSTKKETDKVLVVTAVSRGKESVASIVKGKKLSKLGASKALAGKLDPETVMITDECSSYKTVAMEQPTITHKTINSKNNRTQKPLENIHLQTVNNQHKQIREFLQPFNGVATKYLANYINWLLYKQLNKNRIDKIKIAMFHTLLQVNALEFFSKIINSETLIRT